MKITTYENGGIVDATIYIQGMTAEGSVKVTNTPVDPMEAVNKAYVDNKVSALDASSVTSGTIAILGNVFSGDLLKPTSGGDTFLKTITTAGTYPKVTVNEKGLVTAGAALTEADIPNLSWDKFVSGKPTTLSGYGITDALSTSGGTLTGSLTLANAPTANTHAATKAYVDSKAQGGGGTGSGYSIGDVMLSPLSTTPEGSLRCNGGFVDKSVYAALYAVIGDSFTETGRVGSGQPWRQQYDLNTLQTTNTGAWSMAGVIPVALSNSQAIVTKNRVYLLGGISGGGVANVYTAPINVDGTLGAWTTSAALPGTVYGGQAVVTKNRVYMLAGSSGDAVYTAPINEDGTLGAWTTGTSLPGALQGSQAVLTRNRVYLLGGTNGGGLSTVYTAPINEDGTLGTWTTGTPLFEALYNSHVAVTKNRVYLLGGNNSGGYTSNIYTATINGDGTLGSWSRAGNLPGTRVTGQVAVFNKRVYLFGGTSTGGYTNVTNSARINDDGTLGSWTTGPSLSVALAESQCIVTNSRVYLLGGANASGGSSNTYSALVSGGLSDCSPYYSKSFPSSNMFGLPDYTANEISGLYGYIKY